MTGWTVGPCRSHPSTCMSTITRPVEPGATAILFSFIGDLPCPKLGIPEHISKPSADTSEEIGQFQHHLSLTSIRTPSGSDMWNWPSGHFAKRFILPRLQVPLPPQ